MSPEEYRNIGFFWEVFERLRTPFLREIGRHHFTKTDDLAIFVMHDLDTETRLPSHTAHCCDGRRTSVVHGWLQVAAIETAVFKQTSWFPNGQFQHHHSGPLAEEQCDRWKHQAILAMSLTWLAQRARPLCADVVLSSSTTCSKRTSSMCRGSSLHGAVYSSECSSANSSDRLNT